MFKLHINLLYVQVGDVKEQLAPLTDEEMEAVTVVFHQFETGLREGTIYTKVNRFSYSYYKQNEIRVALLLELSQ